MPTGNEWHDRRVTIKRDPTFAPLMIGDKPIAAAPGDTSSRRLHPIQHGPTTLEEWVTHLQAMPGGARKERLKQLFNTRHPLYTQIRDALLTTEQPTASATPATIPVSEEFVLTQPPLPRNAPVISSEPVKELDAPSGIAPVVPLSESAAAQSVTVMEAIKKMKAFKGDSSGD